MTPVEAAVVLKCRVQKGLEVFDGLLGESEAPDPNVNTRNSLPICAKYAGRRFSKLFICANYAGRRFSDGVPLICANYAGRLLFNGMPLICAKYAGRRFSNGVQFICANLYVDLKYGIQKGLQYFVHSDMDYFITPLGDSTANFSKWTCSLDDLGFQVYVFLWYFTENRCAVFIAVLHCAESFTKFFTYICLAL